LRIIACALLAIVGTVVHGAEVYRSTDANGTVTYSDRPQDDNSQYIYIPTPGPSAAPQRSAQGAQGQQPTPGTQAAEPPLVADGAPVPRSRQEINAERAQNCTVARQRLQTYTTSRRLYRELPGGEREYLSDDQLDEARARAAADVETWCS
jgi:hypothetical protein